MTTASALVVAKCACHDWLTFGKVGGKCALCGKKPHVVGNAKPADKAVCKHTGPCSAPVVDPALSFPY